MIGGTDQAKKENWIHKGAEIGRNVNLGPFRILINLAAPIFRYTSRPIKNLLNFRGALHWAGVGIFGRISFGC